MHVPADGVGVTIKAAVERRLAAEPAAQGELEAARRQASRAFWEHCTNTHLAPPEYYEVAKAALDERLPALVGAGDVVLDVGCGNGEMTLLAAARGARVFGVDVAPALVSKARRRAAADGFRDARFEVQDLAAPLPDPGATVIFCLGVLACLDDAMFDFTLDALAARLPPGGRLVLRESVTSGVPQRIMHPHGHYAHYRNVDAYLAAVARRGFTLVDGTRLFSRDGLEGHLWVLRRGA
jgi:cyclopropane fatty-acyl-phospholipid synthase-like methyltransferase